MLRVGNQGQAVLVDGVVGPGMGTFFAGEKKRQVHFAFQIQIAHLFKGPGSHDHLDVFQRIGECFKGRAQQGLRDKALRADAQLFFATHQCLLEHLGLVQHALRIGQQGHARVGHFGRLTGAADE